MFFLLQLTLLLTLQWIALHIFLDYLLLPVKLRISGVLLMQIIVSFSDVLCIFLSSSPSVSYYCTLSLYFCRQ